jgi:hypothetical protein
MALPRRYLIPLFRRIPSAWQVPVLLVFIMGIHLSTFAQTPSVPVPTFRAIAIDHSVSGILYDHRGKSVTVTAGINSYSKSYPLDGHQELSFYRMVPAENKEDPPRRETLKTIAVSGQGPLVIFMLAGADIHSTPHILAFDDSMAAHPLDAVRICNFSWRHAAVNIGNESIELSSGQSLVFPYVNKKIWLKAATKETEGWKLRISAPQITIPGHRSTLAIIDQPVSVDRPDTRELLVRNIIDQ